jgi:hypothetical protein
MRQSEMALTNADIEVYQQDPSFPRESRPDLAEIMKFAYAYRASMSVDARTIPASTELALFLAGSDRSPPPFKYRLFTGGYLTTGSP